MKLFWGTISLYFIFSICCAVESDVSRTTKIAYKSLFNTDKIKKNPQTVSFLKKNAKAVEPDVFRTTKNAYTLLFNTDKIKNFPQAVSFLKKNAILDSSMKIPEPGFSASEKLLIYNFLGVLAAKDGYFDDAVHFYECAIKMIASTDNASQLAVILENYAAILIRAQQYDKAVEYSRLAAELYKRMNKKLPRALCGNIGTSAFFQGEYDKALKIHIDSCMDLLESDKQVTCTAEEVTLLYNVAWDYCALGQPQKAIDFLIKAQKSVPKNSLRSYRSRLLYLKAMTFPLENVKAELIAEEAKVSEDLVSNTKTYHLLARAEIAKRENHWNNVASLLIGALKLQHPQMLKQSSVSSLPAFLQTYNARCMAIAEAFTRAQNHEMAWYWVQRARNNAEKRALVNGQTTELSPILEIEEKISTSSGNADMILQLEQQYEAAKQKLKNSNPSLWQSLFSQRVNIHPDDLDQIRHALPPNAVLLETALIGDNIIFFLCEKSSTVRMITFPVPQGGKKVKRMILQFKQMISSPNNLSAMQTTCNEFYKILFSPIENEISKIKPDVILYSPVGVLRYIPIAAFYSGGRYLCERFLFCNLSGYDILRLKDVQTKRSLKTFVGFANPDGSLPASEQECDSISRLFINGSVFRGGQATRASFLQLHGKIDCVHVATHGVLNPSEPEKSHLIFADRPLTYTEMTAGLPLMKDLYMLTLSSCNSATTSGLNENAMEIYGMAYQFIRKTDSGATLATLWPISDEHTNQFMTLFYKSLLTGYAEGQNFNRAIALNKAQCEMIKKQATMHPFYWASFILIGNFN